MANNADPNDASQALIKVTPTMDQVAAALPVCLVTLLERRYLSSFDPQQWQISLPEGGHDRPLLRAVTRIGRPQRAGDWGKAMPYLLSACHDPGHAMVMLIHGDKGRHCIYLGGRRSRGIAARSTEDYMNGQESALKAFFTGLRMDGGVARLDEKDAPLLNNFIQTAPLFAAMTGIPSGRADGLPMDFQSFDRLVDAVGAQNYILEVVAEPIEPWMIDQTVDLCRRLLSEVHSLIRRTVSRSTGETQGVSRVEGDPMLMKVLPMLPAGFFLLSALSFVHQALGGFTSVGFATSGLIQSAQANQSRQLSSSSSTNESVGTDLLDATAEACAQLIQQYINRLQSAKSSGWWQTAVYVAAHDEAALNCVTAAVKSICSGVTTSLDPIRTLSLPPHLLRDAMTRADILNVLPTVQDLHHPLGPTYERLATCLTSEELALFVNMPQREIPGLPMRDHAEFSLTVPPPGEHAISLGMLKDSLGHDLDELTVSPETLNRHLFIAGMTGYGKTNTCMRVLLETYGELGVPFLVIEPAKAEYRELADRPHLQGKLRVYTLGYDSPLPLRLNPLNPLPGLPLGRHIDLLKAVFNASFPDMGHGLAFVLEDALLDVYRDRGWSLYTSSNMFLDSRATLDEISALTPNLEDLDKQIDCVLERKKYASEVNQNLSAALHSRLRSLMVGAKGMILNTRRSTPLKDLFDSPTVIELQNLGDDEEKSFVMAVIFVLLYQYAELRRRSNASTRHSRRLQHLTMIEEAHRLLSAPQKGVSADAGDPRGKAVSMFSDMMAEMRAYGEGFIIADQSPTKLISEVLKNSNLKIVHRLSYPDDRQAAGTCMNLTEHQTRHLNNLAAGYAVVHDERIGEAVLTRIHQVKDLAAGSAWPAALTASPFAVMEAGEKRFLQHHAGCGACPSPCEFFSILDDYGLLVEGREAYCRFMDAAVLSRPELAVGFWEAWHGRLREKTTSLLPLKREAVFCLAVQHSYFWITERLISPRPLSDQSERKLPALRLKRERIAGAISPFLLTWTTSEEPLKDAEDGLVPFKTALGQAMNEELPPCGPAAAACGWKCLLLPFVLPHLPALEKPVRETAFGSALPYESRLQALLARLHHKSPYDHLSPSSPGFLRDWLYCLTANLPLSEDMSGQRAEFLSLLHRAVS